MVKSMYEKVLKKNLVSSWGPSPPLTIILNDKEEPNAFFGPIKKALIFRFFRDITSGQTVYTSLMFDVITHEAGHYFLDCMQPQWIFSQIVESQAIHEAFGDMTTLLTLLDNKEICESLAQVTTDLHKPCFFSNFSEQFGMALLRKNDGLRNADDDVKLGQTQAESHDMSRVLVGAVYDIICDMTDAQKLADPNKKFGTILYDVGEQIKHLILQAVINGPVANPTFAQFITEMSKAAQTPEISCIITKIAKEKLIL